MLHIPMYMYMYMYITVCIYIYVQLHVHIQYIYIYIYSYIHIYIGSIANACNVSWVWVLGNRYHEGFCVAVWFQVFGSSIVVAFPSLWF